MYYTKSLWRVLDNRCQERCAVVGTAPQVVVQPPVGASIHRKPAACAKVPWRRRIHAHSAARPFLPVLLPRLWTFCGLCRQVLVEECLQGSAQGVLTGEGRMCRSGKFAPASNENGGEGPAGCAAAAGTLSLLKRCSRSVAYSSTGGRGCAGQIASP
jgi:hypothetical protein